MFLFACFPALNWNWLVWFACFPLIAALACEPGLKRGFLLGYITGAIFLAGSCYWFVLVIEHYGGLGPVLAGGILLLFVIVFALFYGAFGLIESWVARRSQAGAILLSPFLWVAIELARTYLITGFPWNLLGYAVSPLGLRQVASYTAVYGLSFIAVSVSAAIAWIVVDLRSKPAWIMASALVVVLAAGNLILFPPPSPAGTSVAYLVQPVVPLNEGGENWAPWLNPGPLEGLVKLTEASVAKGIPPNGAPPLVIWPEDSAPFYFDRDPVFRGAVEGLAQQTRAITIFGTVTFVHGDLRLPHNSAVVLDPSGRELLQYDKIHLVPFGEYVPAWAFPGQIGKITSQVGDFVPGTSYQIARAPEGTIAVFICYEAIFPQLVRRLTKQGAGVLVNISDDAWYGQSPAAAQHFEMARMRAIENGRYLLRDTNDGITAIIDPQGRVVERIPRRQVRVLEGDFRFISRETFYTVHGDLFAWLCVAVTAMAMILSGIATRKHT